MWYLKYNDGLHDRCVPIYTERFHCMNATDWRDGYFHNFQSYETVIATVAKEIRTMFVSPAFDCSSATIHQFSRWLRENDYPDYYQVKAAMGYMRKHETPSRKTANGWTVVWC